MKDLPELEDVDVQDPGFIRSLNASRVKVHVRFAVLNQLPFLHYHIACCNVPPIKLALEKHFILFIFVISLTLGYTARQAVQSNIHFEFIILEKTSHRRGRQYL